jgi:co-chaperonin GroES (HSP10)
VQSKYLKEFQVLRETGLMPKVRGECMVVECLPKQEMKTAGGIILGAVDKTHRGTAEDTRRGLAIIVAIGEAVTEFEVGQVVLLPYSPLYLSEFYGIKGYTQNTIALVNESDILVSYKSLSQLEEIETALA